ncbi:cation diffusion facilitator family transporter [Desulforhopalus singaporensis]|nr:cation diffusion facilitator family transporter [Desulforhopalus singaporensis]
MIETSERVAWLSILVNLVLVSIKTALAFLSGSIAVRADALHSLADVLSSIIIIIGIKISKRSSRAFPYGLYKVENLVALVTSVLIVFAGYEIIKKVFDSRQSIPTDIPLTCAGIIGTIIIAWLFSRYELKVGLQTKSPSLIADSRHILTDVLSSVVILAAMVGSAIGFALDRYAAVVVVLFIGRAAIRIFLDSVRVLLDASLDFDTLSKIRDLVLADARVLEINGIWGRNAGRYKFVELDISLHVQELQKGHRISEELENRIKLAIPEVDRVLIHYQPRTKKHLVYGIPLAEDKKTISDHFGEAPFFRLCCLENSGGGVVNEQVLVNPYCKESKAKGIKVAKWLLENNMDILLTHQDQSGKGPGFVLGDGGAEILLTSEVDSNKAIAAVQEEMRHVTFPVKE